jgi:hypothetical protein
MFLLVVDFNLPRESQMATYTIQKRQKRGSSGVDKWKKS